MIEFIMEDLEDVQLDKKDKVGGLTTQPWAVCFKMSTENPECWGLVGSFQQAIRLWVHEDAGGTDWSE